MSKNVELLRGKITAKGNLSAYDDELNRYFINKQMCEEQKWLKTEDVKFPFWAKVQVDRTVTVVDEKGVVQKNDDGSEKTITRDQVTAIFATQEDLIAHSVRKATTDIEIKAQIHNRATVAGLSEKVVEQLVLLEF